MTRVVIADDTLLVREGLLHILAAQPEIEVVAVCEDGDSALEAVEAHRPDVLLTDIRMPPSNEAEGIALARRLREHLPEIAVIVLSQYAEPSYVLALFDTGSARRGYLLKERLGSGRQLVDAINVVVSGGSYVDPKIVDTLVAGQDASQTSRLDSLTVRERQVLTSVAAGKSNQAISRDLAIGQRAVERHINSIFAKLGMAEDTGEVSRRVKATLLYLAEAGEQRVGPRPGARH
jgi:DNA-binding NarL/FixJ family response regulator